MQRGVAWRGAGRWEDGVVGGEGGAVTQRVTGEANFLVGGGVAMTQRGAACGALRLSVGISDSLRTACTSLSQLLLKARLCDGSLAASRTAALVIYSGQAKVTSSDTLSLVLWMTVGDSPAGSGCDHIS